MWDDVRAKLSSYMHRRGCHKRVRRCRLRRDIFPRYKAPVSGNVEEGNRRTVPVFLFSYIQSQV